MIQVEIVNIVK